PKIGTLIKKYLLSKSKQVIVNKQSDNKPEITWENLPINKRLKRCKERAAGQFGYAKASEELKKNLFNIINTCQSNNITIIGVKFPITQDYIAETNNKNYGADSIVKSFGYTVLDFKDDLQFNNSMFVNEDHLNKAGGKILANLLFNNSNLNK
ncbi:MAG: hypothetical protein ACPG6B_11595, partial [Oceanihabitans sp.]